MDHAWSGSRRLGLSKLRVLVSRVQRQVLAPLRRLLPTWFLGKLHTEFDKFDAVISNWVYSSITGKREEG